MLQLADRSGSSPARLQGVFTSGCIDQRITMLHCGPGAGCAIFYPLLEMFERCANHDHPPWGTAPIPRHEKHIFLRMPNISGPAWPDENSSPALRGVSTDAAKGLQHL